MKQRATALAASLAVMTAGALAVAAAGAARADGGYKACKVGDRVADKEGKTGTVADVESGGVYCHVDMDGGEKHQYFIFWMLHPAGKPLVDPAQVARIAPGKYSCYAGNPTHYTFMDIFITGPASYKDNRGTSGAFSYAPATQAITFRSGAFKGSYAKYLENHTIGLASKPTDGFATTCDLQK